MLRIYNRQKYLAIKSAKNPKNWVAYDKVATAPESWVQWKSDFQSASSVKKGAMNLFLSISMAYNVISCQKVAENTQILKIAKFAM